MRRALGRWPVVVTRDEPGDGPLSTELRALGLKVLSWPVLQVLPADAAPLAAALREVERFHWIVFASRHAVAAVTSLLSAPPPALCVAAVGESTAQALREAGWRVDLVPQRHNAEGLVAELAPRLQPGTRLLYPASSRSLPTLPQGLAAQGCDVVRVEAYRTAAAGLDPRACDAAVTSGIGAVTFTSPSAVQELDQALGEGCFDRLLSHSFAVTLGSTTAHALAARGFSSVLAAPATLPGLARTTHQLIQLRT